MDAQRDDRIVSDAVAVAQTLGSEIRASADQIERDRQLPQALVDAMIETGIFKLSVPRAFGGAEADPMTLMDVIEEVSRADGSAGWCLMVPSQTGMFAALLPQTTAEEIFHDPRAYLAGVVVTAGRAVVVDGGYRVTGRWKYASGCLHATWLLGTCAVYEGEHPRLGADGQPEIRWVVFPVAECQIIDTWHVMGLRGTGSHDFAVEDTFVPAERSCPRSIAGLPGFVDPRYHTGPLYTFGISAVDPTFVAVGLGIARGALDAFVAMVAEPGGGKGHLRENAMIHAEIGKAEAQLRAARAWLYEAVEAGWESVTQTGELPTEQRLLIRLASRHASVSAAQVVESVWYAAGAAAIFESNPLERRFRDVHAVGQRVSPAVYGEAGQLWLGLDSSA
jgi:alkylation response protein AidB-like acyl-CoA dehydrogenase